jgi:pyruvate/2-oxoacid:ferredoxin oxidoreductase beta subunit
MTGRQIITDAQNTWCPGCGNFSIQHTLKNILTEMEHEGKSLDDVVLVTAFTRFMGVLSPWQPQSNLATRA